MRSSLLEGPSTPRRAASPDEMTSPLSTISAHGVTGIHPSRPVRILPKNMRNGTTRRPCNLELQSPQLRPEAFPWGSTNVEIHAVFASQAHRRVISLPGVMDLSALPFPGGEAGGLPEAAESLDVEIVGCDNGVTFTLGNASIRLPPTLQPTSIPESQFRVCLTGEQGVRNGTLVGKFQACSPTNDDSGAGDTVGFNASQSHPCPAALGEVQETIAGEAADGHEAKSSMVAKQASKANHQRLEHEAIQLLEAATKILASPTSCVRRRALSADSPAPRVAVQESTKEPGFQDVLRRRQVLEGPPTDVSGDFNVGALDFTLDSATPSKEEDDLPLPPGFPTAGFKFEPTTGNVEWQRIASVNVSKVEREGDLQTLKQFLPEVAVGMVDEDDFDANPGLVKAFRLAQLQTQYALHCSQVLQRQCDGLETTVASMELEIKGNSQGSTALKNRARLLRKESRKQDKIINGYAAMLRTHNPGLSSKVYLDEKGRLKVHNATRHREHGKRRTKRRHRAHRDHQSRTLGGGTLDNNGSRSCTDTEGSGFGSGVSQGTTSSHWSEAGRLAPTFGSPRRRSNTETTATSVPGDQRSAFHLDFGEETKASPTQQRGCIDTEQDLTIRNGGSRGETFMTPRGRRGSGSNAAAEGHARTSDDNVVQVRPRYGASRAGLSLRGHTREDALPTHRDDSRESPTGGFDPRGSKSGASVVTGQGIGALASDRDGWEGADPDDDASKIRTLEGRSVSSVEGTSNSDEHAPSTGHRRCVDRTPRVVTVSVKPKRNDRPTSASSQEENRATLPQRQGWQTGNTINLSDADLSRRDDGIDSTKAPPTTPGFADERGGIPSTESMTARGNAQPLSGGGGANREEYSREFASSGAKDMGEVTTAPGSFTPVAAASQLGLEGDEFPDVSEFDLDDLSEIDAMEGWAGSVGGGSLSS